jgi:hypothetical protein
MSKTAIPFSITPFVSVPYRGHWFWIEEKDLPTKTTLAAVAILFNFLEAGGAKDAPC